MNLLDRFTFPLFKIGKFYIYLKDLTGNIIGIYNEYGKEVARYTYDAYGNHEVLDEYGIINNNATFIGNINPFRYKGYYYDVETGLYYCNSRYYNSKIYRWISADDIDYLEPESINGLNLYVYCGDDLVISIIIMDTLLSLLRLQLLVLQLDLDCLPIMFGN